MLSSLNNTLKCKVSFAYKICIYFYRIKTPTYAHENVYVIGFPNIFMFGCSTFQHEYVP